MDEKNNELLPCPFCGGHANESPMLGVWCDNEACAITGMVFSGGARHWNKRSTPASSATSGEAVTKAELWDAIHQYVSDYGDQFRLPPTTGAGQRCDASRDELDATINRLFAARPAVAPDSAQQGEDEPPLPEPLDEVRVKFRGEMDYAEAGGQYCTISYAKNYGDARAAHARAHMMRKLGDGVSIDTPEFRELMAEYANTCLLTSTGPAILRRVIAHIDAKLAQARTEGFEHGKRFAHEQACTITHALMAERDQWKARAAGAERAVPEGTRLRKALEAVRDTLQQANEKKNGPICDTIWMTHGGAETLFDFIESELAAAPSPQEGKAVEGGPVWDESGEPCNASAERVERVEALARKLYSQSMTDSTIPAGMIAMFDDLAEEERAKWVSKANTVIPAAQQDSAQVAGKDGAK